MLYFIQAGNKIKIGRGNVVNRLRTIKTASPEPCKLLLAISLRNEVGAETTLHRHFKDYRSNGEWFDINFTSAFRALLDLKLIPDHEQPHLEIPTVEPIPLMHPDFVKWFLVTGDRPFWQKEELDYASANIKDYWASNYRSFGKSLRLNVDIESMIKADGQVSDEELFRSLKAMLKQQTID